jgi:hypothetical protein
MVKFSMCTNNNIKKKKDKIFKNIYLYNIHRDLCYKKIISFISTLKLIKKIKLKKKIKKYFFYRKSRKKYLPGQNIHPFVILHRYDINYYSKKKLEHSTFFHLPKNPPIKKWHMYF